MRLRKLEQKDASLMLEWMTDDRVNQYFRFDPKKITIETTRQFIRDVAEDKNNVHLAIVGEEDIYQGTVSLKEIDTLAGTAEFAIALRSAFQGLGLGKLATKAILQYGFEVLNLNRIYLNVLSDNQRAAEMYEKIGFQYEGAFLDHVMIHGELKSLKWYRMMRNEYERL